MRAKRVWAIAPIGVAVAAMWPVASAQAQTNEAVAPESSDVIVVTAQRRGELLQDVPVSVSAFSGDQLETLGVERPDDLAAITPNLQVNSVGGGGAPIFSLRGVSMSDFSLNQASPVALYFDEVYRGNPALIGVTMYDLERVEVLRGPQGTLYGRNTTGGAVNFITRTADFAPEARISATYASHNRTELEGAAQSGIGDTLAVRGAFYIAKDDGWLDNRLAGQPDMEQTDEWGVRGSALWRPSDDFELILRASTSGQKPVNYGIIAQPGEFGVGNGLYALFNSIDPGLNPKLDYFRTGLGAYDIESNYTAKRNARADSLSLTANWSLTSTLDLTSISSWDRGRLINPEDTDGSPLSALEILYEDRARQWAQELRLTSDTGGPFDFIVGAYYSDESVRNSTQMRFYQDIDFNLDGALDFLDCVSSLDTLADADPDNDLFPAGCQARNSFEQEKRSWALFADASWEITDWLTLRGGLRYTDDDAKLSNFNAQLLGSDGVVLANTIPGDPLDVDAVTSRKFSGDKVSGRFGVDIHTPRGDLIYASYNTGYRAGAFNAQAFFDPSELTIVRPETIKAMEIGYKSTWFDEQLTFNAAVFEYQYEGQQFLDVDPNTALQLLVNIDRSKIRGAEFDLSFRPDSTFTLSAGVGVLDAEIEEGVLRGADISGNSLPQAPDFSANLGVDWTFASGDWGALSLHADGRFVSSQYFEALNVQRLRQEAYRVFNAQLGYVTDDGLWSVSVFGRNLGAEEYFTSRIDISNFGFDYNHIGAPRTWGVTVSREF